MSAFAKKLKKLQTKWEAGKKAKSDFGGSSVDDGTYRTRLIDASVFESQKGAMFAKLEFEVTEGDFKGQKIGKLFGLDGKNADKTMGFLQMVLEKFDVEVPEDLSELPEVLEELKAKSFSVLLNARTKNDFQNINVIRLLDEDEDDGEGKVSDDEDEDEAPKKGKVKKAKDDEDEDDEDESEEDDEEDEADEEDEESDDEESDDEEDEDEDEDDEEDEEEKPKKKSKKSDDEDEESDDDEDEEEADEEDEEEKPAKKKKSKKEAATLEIGIGVKVKVPYKGGTIKGKIVSIDEKKETVKVKLPNGEKKTFPFDELEAA